jgi:hypothetical protein
VLMVAGLVRPPACGRDPALQYPKGDPRRMSDPAGRPYPPAEARDASVGPSGVQEDINAHEDDEAVYSGEI